MVPGPNWGSQDEADSIAAIHAGLDDGINWIDTAPAYGDGASEKLVGKALQGRRDQVLIATKISTSDLAKHSLLDSCEKSLRLLQTDYIDLLQVHWPSPSVPPSETFEALLDLREQGKVREVGVCNFGTTDLETLDTLQPGPVSNQVCYNLLFRAVEYAVLPASKARSMGLLCYSPLAQGLLTGKFKTPKEVPDARARTRHFSKNRSQVRHGEEGAESETFAAIAAIAEVAQELGISMEALSLAWLIAQEGVCSVIAGARNPEQARRNAEAGRLELSDHILQHLADATAPLKERLGDNADAWQGSGESRVR